MKKLFTYLLSLSILGCFSIASFAQCNISNVYAEAHACESNGTFYVDVEFDVTGTSSNTFQILGNGNNYGTFTYGQTFYTVGPIAGNGTTLYEFLIQDGGDSSCFDFYEFVEPIICEPCQINEFWVEVYDCNGDGNAAVDLGFTYSNVGNIGFDLFLDGVFHSFQTTYPNPYITIDNFLPGDGQAHVISINDNDNPNCAAVYTVIAPDCSTPACGIGAVNADFIECATDGTFLVGINFEHVNTSGSFTVQGNGMNHGTYNYSSLPIFIDGLAGDGSTLYEFVIIDSEDPNCSNWGGFVEPITCSSAECVINEVWIETDASLCDANGMFDAYIGFNIVNGLGGFDLQVNNMFHSYHSSYPTSSGLLIEDIALGNGEPVVLTINDNDNPNCATAYTFIAPNCSTGECEIGAITATILDCNNNNGNFAVSLDFESANTSGSFSVHGNGNNYGTWSYNSLPIIIDGLAGDGNTVYEFVINDNDFPNCVSNYTTVTAPNCEGSECVINEIWIETDASLCDANGMFDAYIGFNITNGLGGFDLHVNGVFHSYHSSYPAGGGLLVEDIAQGNGQTIVLTINDNDHPSCVADFSFIAPNCSTGECVINEIWIETDASLCDANGMFDAYIGFNIVNGLGGFDLHVNGVFHSYHSSYPAGGGLLVEDIAQGNGQTIVLTINDNDHPSCVADFSFIAPNCNTIPECDINELVLSTDCNSDGNFVVVLDFNVVNPTSATFIVGAAGGGETYSYTDLPLVLGPYNGDGSTVLGFEVFDTESVNCAAYTQLTSPYCEGNNACYISDVQAEAYACDANGNFLVDIWFNSNDVGTGFQIVGNGQNYGSFDYGENYYTIGPLVGNGMVYEFGVQDLDHPNCGSFTEITAPNCTSNGDCNINEVWIETDVSACDNNGLFGAYIGFNISNGLGSGFDLFVNNTFHSYHNSYPTGGGLFIEAIALGNGEPVVLTIIDNDNPNCVNNYTFIAPNCESTPEPDCDITYMIAEAHDCNGDDVFYVDIEFGIVNPGNDGFQIVGNGTNYGTFGYGETFYTVGPIAANGSIYEFGIQDLNHPNCTAWTGLQAPNCIPSTECAITNLFAEAWECNADGTFNIDLGFGYVGITNNFFDVTINGNNQGYYEYSNAGYITIENFAVGDGSTLVIGVNDNDNPNCAAVFTLEAPDCTVGTSDCVIGNITAVASDCGEDDTFSISLDFDAINSGSSFTVQGNGNNYGSFSYSSLPITIDGFEGNGLNVYELVINDGDNPNCSGNYTVITAQDCFLAVELRVFLEGAYDESTGAMRTTLKDNGVLSTTQPFDRAPWGYSGTESVADVSSFPATTVDWVLVSVHDPNDNYSILEERAGLLLSNGDVVDADGSGTGVKFQNISRGGYYISVKSRNHIGILSPNAVALPDPNPYNFTDASNVMGTFTQVSNFGNVAACKAGDFDSNGVITVDDFNYYLWQSAAVNTYLDSDCNMDGNVSINDFNQYRSNVSSVGMPQLRY